MWMEATKKRAKATVRSQSAIEVSSNPLLLPGENQKRPPNVGGLFYYTGCGDHLETPHSRKGHQDTYGCLCGLRFRKVAAEEATRREISLFVLNQPRSLERTLGAGQAVWTYRGGFAGNARIPKRSMCDLSSSSFWVSRRSRSSNRSCSSTSVCKMQHGAWAVRGRPSKVTGSRRVHRSVSRLGFTSATNAKLGWSYSSTRGGPSGRAEQPNGLCDLAKGWNRLERGRKRRGPQSKRGNQERNRGRPSVNDRELQSRPNALVGVDCKCQHRNENRRQVLRVQEWLRRF